jgi:hypothetical protein
VARKSFFFIGWGPGVTCVVLMVTNKNKELVYTKQC